MIVLHLISIAKRELGQIDTKSDAGAVCSGIKTNQTQLGDLNRGNELCAGIQCLSI